MGLKNLHNVIVALQEAQGTNEKIRLLEASGGDDLREYLNYVYSPEFNYYFTDMKKVTSLPGDESEVELHDMAVMLDRLSNREVTGNEAIVEINRFISNCDEQSAELFRYALLHDIRAGVSTKTINKAFPGLIPVTPYMRCDLLSNVNIDNWNFSGGDVVVQEKFDGMFCNFIVYPGLKSYKAVTRSGSMFPPHSFDHICNDILNGLDPDSPAFVIHGELLVRNVSTDELLPREESNGIYNSMLKEGHSLTDNHHPFMVAWDTVPLESFLNGALSNPYRDRLHILDTVIPNDSKHIQVANTVVVNSLDDALAIYQQNLKNGKEGIVLKNLNMPWKSGTSKFQLKFKLTVQAEFKITGFKEGSGKFKGMVGAILCESEDNMVETSAGAMKDDVRQYITDHQESLLGSVVSIKFNAMLDPIAPCPMYHLTHPRFDGLRPDKQEANTLKEIQDIIQNTIVAVKS